ncbi:aminoglycoside N(3)-acetyltransferase [Guptibacillus algicola]|uniref:aminoglycoside N(3)-acetyltransferase n=1 Tax=Guptibacillus algicola TaxID=225844 RepID=UPI001CD4E840|nr:AAC(3) family N-acetyltransferase [Alkalihalobacillus algicola]MCA0988737.1 AAC(3) family N-acetyltransferase [Alkalihalobacillus algicola]
MTEKRTTESMIEPHTITSLVDDFRGLGVKEGMTILVHSSLSSLGWVCGGPEAVIRALIESVGEEGTIVMPAQSAGNSDPANWMNPPVPESWWQIIRANMPAYCKDTTPTRGMGVIAELFRTMPGVKRSNHPTYSFTAWGKQSDYILEEQPLEAGFGDRSPLAKIYELDGMVLMLGVGHDSNTSLHYAEHGIPNPPLQEKSAALIENGERVWKTFKEIDYDSDVFEQIGKEFEKSGDYYCMKIGKATCKLIEQRKIVDFGREWYQKQSM